MIIHCQPCIIKNEFRILGKRGTPIGDVYSKVYTSKNLVRKTDRKIYPVDILYICTVLKGKGVVVSDLFTESLALQRIQLIARVVLMDVCSGDDKELALVWISELTAQLLEQVNNKDERREMSASCQ